MKRGLSMIRKYTFGTPFSTDAVVLSLPAETGPVPFFTLSRKGNQVILTRKLQPEDCLYGLGETVRGINKRGFLYRSWNSDVFNHTESTESLYASHNLLIFSGSDCLFGIYADDPGRVTWDLGYTRSDTAVITSDGECFPADVVVSAIHPANTIKLVDSHLLRPAYRRRLEHARNTTSAFTLYLKFRKNRVKYLNHNMLCSIIAVTQYGVVRSMMTRRGPSSCCICISATRRILSLPRRPRC